MHPTLHDTAYGVTAAGIADQMSFLTRWLPPAPARVLDAGCGRGDLALALDEAGYTVTAVDNDAEAVTAARARGVDAIRGDFAGYDGDPFDAVVFSLSLHHMSRLPKVVHRARALLKQGGLLLVDEFAWERADGATASWFHDMEAVLDSAFTPAPPERRPLAEDPYTHWIKRHRPLHPGEAMIDAIGAAFKVRKATRGPYLHRYLADRISDDDAGARVFTMLRRIERQRILGGGLAAVGLRVVAQATH
ncbi:class I SAM-dependent methyltransferase [Sphaerisporangium sp. B11E5]|uniref:class I SAM-dependent methyltransferase n=1 Tax=Sphaerisporangium sp. B11E5 TaxID=3153563 RepID=UPI00325C5C4F